MEIRQKSPKGAIYINIGQSPMVVSPPINRESPARAKYQVYRPYRASMRYFLVTGHRALPCVDVWRPFGALGFVKKSGSHSCRWSVQKIETLFLKHY